MAARKFGPGRDQPARRKQLSTFVLCLGFAAFLGICVVGQSTAFYTDIFNGTDLNPQWTWENEYPSKWSLAEKPGYLRIYTQVGGFVGEPEAPRNVLLANFDNQTNCRVETHLVFRPTENFQYAGIIFYNNPSDFIAFGRAFCGFTDGGCVGDGLYIDHEENGVWLDQPPVVSWTGSAVYLRVQKIGQNYTFEASSDGATWTRVAEKRNVGLKPASVGIFAVNATAEASSIPADFDYFRMTPPSQ